MKTITINTVTVSENDITIAATWAESTPTPASQMVSVANTPATNPTWTRAIRLSDQAVFIQRYGTAGANVAILLASLAKLACTLEPALSFVPKITTNVGSTSVVANGTSYADFTVVAASETTVTYAWKESLDNGVTWGSALTTTGIYDVSVAGRLRITPASGDVAKNGAKYKCEMTNASGTTTTAIGTLIVTAS